MNVKYYVFYIEEFKNPIVLNHFDMSENESITIDINCFDEEPISFINNWILKSSKKDIFLEIMSEKGEILGSKTFVGCFPISYERVINDKSFYGYIKVNICFDFVENQIGVLEGKEENLFEDIILI